MAVERLVSAHEFLERAESFLLADEGRNNLILGIAGNLRDQPRVYDEHHLWLVESRGEVVGAALRTPPYNLVLAGPMSSAVLERLAESLHSEGVELPGVNGSIPEVEDFVRAWTARTEVSAEPRMSQRIYRLSSVRGVSGVRGVARPGTDADRDLLVEWVEAFASETAPEGGAPTHAAERVVDARLKRGTGGFTIWEDGEPVSLAGWGGRTPNGVRIGPVYTPPAHRRRGYGSAVTAAVTSEQLSEGRQFCFLYTDLANPTSNRLYMEIGYEPVCDSADYRFELPT